MPAEMAYGDVGRWSEKRGQYIEPGACLVFVLTVVKIKGPSRPQPTRPPPGAASEAAAAAAAAAATAAAASKRSTQISNLTEPEALEAAQGVVPQPAASTPPAPPPPALPPAPPAAPAGPPTAQEPTVIEAMLAASATSPEPPDAVPTSSGGGWLGGLFERPTLAQSRADSGAATAAKPSSKESDVEARYAAKLEEQRMALEHNALETVQGILSQLRLPTIKQALNDLGMPVDGGKTALTQRLTERLTQGLVPR